MINVLDFLVKCFYVYLRNGGEDGKYAALIPSTFVLSSFLSFVVSGTTSLFFKEEFSFWQGALVMLGAFMFGYIWVIRKLGKIYIEEGRVLEFNRINFYYYILAPIVFLSSFLWFILALIFIGKYSYTPIGPRL